MLKALEKIGLTDRVSLAAIGTGATNTIGGAAGWIGEHILTISAAATLMLTITMIFTHFLRELRENRQHKIDTIKKELEIEKLRNELEATRHPRIRSVQQPEVI